MMKHASIAFLILASLAGSGCATSAKTRVLQPSAEAKQTYSTTPKVTTTRETIEVTVPDEAPKTEPQSALVPKRVLLVAPKVTSSMLATIASVVEIGGKKVNAPPGSTVKHTTETTTTEPAVTANAEASGTGAGLETTAADGKGDFTTSPPMTNLPGFPGHVGGSSSSGGGASSRYEMTGLPPGVNLFHLMGGLFIAGSVVLAVWVKNMRLAMVAGAVGLTFLAVGFLTTSPFGVWIVLAALAAGLGYYVWNERKDAAKDKALTAAVVGIERADMTGSVKRTVEAAAAGWSDEVDRAVKAVLKREGYGRRTLPPTNTQPVVPAAGA